MTGRGDGGSNGIRAVGTYAPRLRLPASEIDAAWGSVQAAGVERKAVPDADEDALTMAYEAASNALAADGTDGGDVDVLAFASSTPPDAEEDVTVRLGSMLGVDETARREFFGESTQAGTRALASTLESALGPGDLALVVAADCPRGELAAATDHAAGAGAAAFVVAVDGPVTVLDRGTYATPYPGTRFREQGSSRLDGLEVTNYDRAAFRETVAGAVEELEADAIALEADAIAVEDDAIALEEDAGESADDTTGLGAVVDAVAVQAPDGAMAYRVAGDVGVATDAIARVSTVEDLGDTGAASALLSLAVALGDADVSRTLLVGYGSGASADATVLDTTGTVPVRSQTERADATDIGYAEYLRVRDEVTGDPPAGGGAYVSVPSWRRSLPQRHRLIAGRCMACDALAFPPEGACGDCAAIDGYDRVQLPGTGTVEAATTISQGGAPPEFAQHQQRAGEYDVVVVALDAPTGDDDVSAPLQVTDTWAGDVDIGDRVRATIRRIYTQEGVTRYGCKVRPVDGRQ